MSEDGAEKPLASEDGGDDEAGAMASAPETESPQHLPGTTAVSAATPPATPPPTATPASPKVNSSAKIDVLLKPAGNAPILKKKRWTVDRHKQIGWISEFIRKFIRTDTEDSVFVYVNQSFSPSPDTEIGALFDCFGSDGKLVIYYCRNQAWG